MDARKMSVKVLKDAIKNDNYRITGITENGEIVLAIISDTEKHCLKEIFKKDFSNEKRLELVKKLMSMQGRYANELMQIYLQETVSKEEYCLGNGLRIK